MSQEIYKQAILPIRFQLLNIARKLLENEQEAEDAVQEILLKLWRIADSLDRYDNPSALAVTALKNHCLDKIKTQKRVESLTDTTEFQIQNDNPHLQLERKNTEEVLMKIIENLPKLQQMIIIMKDVERYEVEEIAEITGTNAEAVRVNLSRARKKVREEYLKHFSA
ncbi:MAG: sigma-70 family RNA polymerase sigma factor [Paludibacteraceae bacterium]